MSKTPFPPSSGGSSKPRDINPVIELDFQGDTYRMFNNGRLDNFDPEDVFSVVCNATRKAYHRPDGFVGYVKSDVLRIDYDTVTGKSLGALVEGKACTNIWLNSSKSYTSDCETSNILVTPNSQIAPDGSIDNSTIECTSTTGYWRKKYKIGMGTSITYSFFVHKDMKCKYINCSIVGTGIIADRKARLFFNTATKKVEKITTSGFNNYSSYVQELPNFYRIQISFDTPASGLDFMYFYCCPVNEAKDSDTLVTVAGDYICPTYFQLENNPYATSYAHSRTIVNGGDANNSYYYNAAGIYRPNLGGKVKNLGLYSNDFEKAPWQLNDLTVTDKIVGIAYKKDFSHLVPPAKYYGQTSSFPFISRGYSVDSGLYNWSMYFKPNELDTVKVVFGGIVNACNVVVDLTNGLVLSTDNVSSTLFNPTLTLQDDGETYRLTIGVNPMATGILNVTCYFSKGNTSAFSTSGTSGIYVGYSQVLAGAFAKEYSENIDTIVETDFGYIERKSYNPNDLSKPASVLVEPFATTNQFLWSDDFTKEIWTKTNSTVTFSSYIKPNGLKNALMLSDTTTANVIHKLTQAIDVTAGETKTISFFVRSGSLSKCAIILSGNCFPADKQDSDSNILFNIATNKAISSLGTIASDSTKLPNGWIRLSITATATITGTALFSLALVNDSNQIVYTGTGKYISVAMSQCQTGFLTSYVDSKDTANTRSADILGTSVEGYRGVEKVYIAGKKLNDMFNPNDFSVSYAIENFARENTTSNPVISIQDSAGTNVLVFSSNDTAQSVGMSIMGTNVLSFAGVKDKNQVIKFSANKVGADLSINGTSYPTKIPTDLLINIEFLYLCFTKQYNGNTHSSCGHLKYFSLYAKKFDLGKLTMEQPNFIQGVNNDN